MEIGLNWFLKICIFCKSFYFIGKIITIIGKFVSLYHFSYFVPSVTQLCNVGMHYRWDQTMQAKVSFYI